MGPSRPSQSAAPEAEADEAAAGAGEAAPDEDGWCGKSEVIFAVHDVSTA